MSVFRILSAQSFVEEMKVDSLKFSQKGQEKTFVENFLSSKLTEFYLRGIN